MPWHRNSITQGEVEALHEAAKRAWADDTRYPLAASRHGDAGQCYVTAAWLKDRLGGTLGIQGGHYAWLSGDGEYVLDLAPHTGKHFYGLNWGFDPVDEPVNARAEKFIKRANLIFDNLDTLLKLADDYMGDAFPGQEPQRANDIQQDQFLHDEPSWQPQNKEYRFVYANGQLEISPDHDHQELAGHAGIADDHRGPIATGYVTVSNNSATWEVDTNVNIHALDRVFRDYAKHVGWDWGGITNIDGEPISDDFAPKASRTLNYVYADEHLYLGRTSHSAIALGGDVDVGEAYTGRVTVVQGRALVAPVHVAALPSLYEWAEDVGLTLYGGNDNVIKTVEDLELDNTGANKESFDPPRTDERQPSGLYQCPTCNRLFPNWHLYQRHRKDEASSSEPVERGGFPELDPDATHPPHFTEQQPVIMPMARSEAARVRGFGGEDVDEYWVAYHYGSPVAYASLHNASLHKVVEVRPGYRNKILAKIQRYAEKQPKDLIEGPIPFIYDIQDDQISVGEPGARTSDIPGRFTPGGIVEGVYEPGGKVLVRTMTNMPYTVRHMIELWYYQHPELAVTGVHLQDDAGGKTKLAADKEEGIDVGNEIARLVAADPAVYEATKALREEGGNVFAVGGVVRDVLRGKDPKDIDLMVQGLPANKVSGILSALPGRVDVTGRDFGVFRYRHQGNEVEIALPRKERSTGQGHRDFEVQADPNMTPEEDLWRRDFTANSMAVNLATGELLDPYGGQRDILEGRLRAHNPDSLSEDPLRVVRALVANARHGLVPDDGTREQMARNAGSLEALPQERIQQELDKLFGADKPHHAIALARDTGVLQHLLPEVDRAFGYDQNNPHHEHELGDHLLSVLERTSERSTDPDLRLAALLHDIGKHDSAWVDPVTGSNHFYYDKKSDQGADHETVGSDMTRNLMNRLRYPADRTKRVSELVQHHMFPAFTHTKGARRFLNRVGDHADDLLDLRWADQGGKSKYPTDPTLNIDTQRALLNEVRSAGQATNKSQLAINGNDLLAAGVPQGPMIGQIIEQLTQAVVDEPDLNQRDILLGMAQHQLTQ